MRVNVTALNGERGFRERNFMVRSVNSVSLDPLQVPERRSNGADVHERQRPSHLGVSRRAPDSGLVHQDPAEEEQVRLVAQSQVAPGPQVLERRDLAADRGPPRHWFCVFSLEVLRASKSF